MQLLSPGGALWLGLIFGLAEIYLALTKRSQSQVLSQDRQTFYMLWGVIIISIFMAIQMMWLVPGAELPAQRGFYIFGFCIFLIGLVLRWYSVGYLTRYFRINTSADPEHSVVDSGPYRYIRHPTYTGALLAFLGLGFCFGNWLSILFLTLPIIGAFIWRVRIEEEAMLQSIGRDYRDYTRQTERLVPWVY
jgi:protein-S-isoprenylcysteine O-methyltransferase Ste14